MQAPPIDLGNVVNHGPIEDHIEPPVRAIHPIPRPRAQAGRKPQSVQLLKMLGWMGATWAAVALTGIGLTNKHWGIGLLGVYWTTVGAGFVA